VHSRDRGRLPFGKYADISRSLLLRPGHRRGRSNSFGESGFMPLPPPANVLAFFLIAIADQIERPRRKALRLGTSAPARLPAMGDQISPALVASIGRGQPVPIGMVEITKGDLGTPRRADAGRARRPPMPRDGSNRPW